MLADDVEEEQEEEEVGPVSNASFVGNEPRGDGDDIKARDPGTLERAAVAARNCDNGGVCAALASVWRLMVFFEVWRLAPLVLCWFAFDGFGDAPRGVAYLRMRSSTCCFRSFFSLLNGAAAAADFLSVVGNVGTKSPRAARMLNGDGVEAPGTIGRRSAATTEGTARCNAASASGET